MELVLSGFRISVERVPPRRLARPRRKLEMLFARALRFKADRARLAVLEQRLLDDVGLTPEDVTRDVPFREPATRRVAW